MRFGCCIALASFVPPTSGATQLDEREALDARMAQLRDAIRVLEDAGCDFMELGVGLLAPEKPEPVFDALRQTLETTALLPECFNSYVPPDLSLVGAARDMARIENYVAVSARRAADLGGEIIVFGSGKARSIPEGVSRETAETHLTEFLRLAADYAAENGIRIAIEPLNRSESNILTSVTESVALQTRVNRPEIGVLTDFYHLDEENEPFSHIAEAGNALIHVHVADTGRLYPGSGNYDFPGFYRALDTAGYDRRISVECNWRNFPAEVAPAMRFLRESWTAFQSRSPSQYFQRSPS